MATLNIKDEVLEQIVNTLHLSTREKMLNSIEGLGKLVEGHEDNQILDKLFENCKKMQTAYNDHFVPTISALLQEYSTLEQFKDVIARATANMSETKVGQSDVAVDPIQLPEV
jgi:deoxyadenosine/deoxycytidine kinase